MKNKNIINKLQDIFDELSPKLRTLASYIIDHNKEIVFLNATSLAKLANVSEATVTRLTYLLGLNGYQEFKKKLQEEAKNHLALPKYQFKGDDNNLLKKIVTLEKNIMDEMLLGIKQETFEEAVNLMFKARNIIIIGMHYNYMPAAYAAYFLTAFRENVFLAEDLKLETFQLIKNTKKDDVVLVISTARYPKNTQTTVDLLKEKKAQVIAITDSLVSPILEKADLSLIVPMKFNSYIDPYSGMMALLHALITGIFLKDSPNAKKNLKNYFQFMKQGNYNTLSEVDITNLL